MAPCPAGFSAEVAGSSWSPLTFVYSLTSRSDSSGVKPARVHVRDSEMTGSIEAGHASGASCTWCASRWTRRCAFTSRNFRRTDVTADFRPPRRNRRATLFSAGESICSDFPDSEKYSIFPSTHRIRKVRPWRSVEGRQTEKSSRSNGQGPKSVVLPAWRLLRYPPSTRGNADPRGPVSRWTTYADPSKMVRH